MSRENINNNEAGLSVRTKLNSMFTELFEYGVSLGLNYKGILDTGDSVTGSPVQGDFYLIEGADTYGSVVCVQYDAIFYNGSAWEKWSNFGGGKLVETQARSEGSPATGDPLDVATITHTLSRTYINAPAVNIQSKNDWPSIHLDSVTVSSGVCTVVVGIGGVGTASTVDYDLQVFSQEV